jgi:hypothetical protein
MAKEKKTASELEALIRETDPNVGALNIFPDEIYRWRAQSIATPAKVIAMQARVEQIVAELRERFDLKE